MIASVGSDESGQSYNVNADEAAGAVAAAHARLQGACSSPTSRAGARTRPTRRPRSRRSRRSRPAQRLDDRRRRHAAEARGVREGDPGRRARRAHRRRPRSRTRCCSSCSPTRASARRSRRRHDSLADLQALERDYVIGTYARAPVEFVRGEGTRLWDSDGNEYLDFLAGIAVVQIGHSHPRWVEAVTGAGRAARPRREPVLHRARDAAGPAAVGELARRQGVLLQLGRRGGRVRAEAGAAPPARAATWWCSERGFHGRTYGALSATPQEAKQAPFAPLVPGFKVADARTALRRVGGLEHRRRADRADPGRVGHPPAAPTRCCAPRARPATRTARC